MDKILWQTLGAFDLVHSSYKWIPAKSLCGKHNTTMQTRIVCRRPWRLKTNIRRNSAHFRKSRVCANKLDVQETNFSFTQFNRRWNHFSRCRFTHGRYSRSHSLGFGDWSILIPYRTEQMDPRKNHGETRRQLSSQTCITPSQCKHTNVIPTNIDHIPSNTTHSGSGAMLFVFEDNEAVIKMIIKGRSATLRHVSRTHRVALDWLLDRINLDSKIKIGYVDTKHQLGDMLTKGNFTRDEWNNLLHLFNISHFSSTCCTKNFSLISCSTVAKRMQDQKEEERVVSKSRPAAMNLSSFTATSSSTASSPIASQNLVMPIASVKPDSRMSSNSFDAASSGSIGVRSTINTSRLWRADHVVLARTPFYSWRLDTCLQVFSSFTTNGTLSAQLCWLRLKHAGWMEKQCKVESLSDMEEARRDVRIMTHEEEREESWEKGKAVFLKRKEHMNRNPTQRHAHAQKQRKERMGKVCKEERKRQRCAWRKNDNKNKTRQTLAVMLRGI